MSIILSSDVHMLRLSGVTFKFKSVFAFIMWLAFLLELSSLPFTSGD